MLDMLTVLQCLWPISCNHSSRSQGKEGSDGSSHDYSKTSHTSSIKFNAQPICSKMSFSSSVELGEKHEPQEFCGEAKLNSTWPHNTKKTQSQTHNNVKSNEEHELEKTSLKVHIHRT